MQVDLKEQSEYDSKVEAAIHLQETLPAGYQIAGFLFASYA
jgi:hypothetical protein